MNKRCVALSDEQYRESIRLLREGFVLEGKIIKPNPRIATVAVLQASLGQQKRATEAPLWQRSFASSA